MIFIIFSTRQHFEDVKLLNAQLGTMLGNGADLDDGRVVCSHSILPAQRAALNLPALAAFLYSQNVLIRFGGIDGEDYVIA